MDVVSTVLEVGETDDLVDGTLEVVVSSVLELVGIDVEVDEYCENVVDACSTVLEVGVPYDVFDDTPEVDVLSALELVGIDVEVDDDL